MIDRPVDRALIFLICFLGLGQQTTLANVDWPYYSGNAASTKFAPKYHAPERFGYVNFSATTVGDESRGEQIEPAEEATESE